MIRRNFLQSVFGSLFGASLPESNLRDIAKRVHDDLLDGVKVATNGDVTTLDGYSVYHNKKVGLKPDRTVFLCHVPVNIAMLTVGSKLDNNISSKDADRVCEIINEHSFV